MIILAGSLSLGSFISISKVSSSVKPSCCVSIAFSDYFSKASIVSANFIRFFFLKYKNVIQHY